MSVFPAGGGLGVVFFFVLGGFAMTLGYHQKVFQPEFRYGNYLAKRASKFYPLHWICLLAVLPLCFDSFSWLTFSFNVALLHSWVPIEEFYFSYNSLSWYLANTLFFAVIFPFLFKWITHSSKLSKWVSVIVLVLAYILLALYIPDNQKHAILYVNPIVRLLDFIVGVSAGLLFLKIKENQSVKSMLTKHSKLLNWLVFILIAVVVVQSIIGYLLDIKFCFPLLWPLIVTIIIITSLLGWSKRSGLIIRNKYLVKLGDYSFSFYMLHLIIIRYLYKFIRPSLCLLTDNRYFLQIMLLIVCFVTTLLFTIIIHNYINKPVTQWLTRKIQRSTTVL
jgi:peptidoglycan/LPS O-acetylase OafA/YrhL